MAGVHEKATDDGTSTSSKSTKTDKMLAAMQAQNEALQALVLAFTSKAAATTPVRYPDAFDENHESFVDYLDRVETHFAVNQVSTENKKMVFVSMLKPKHHNLPKSLVYPDSYTEKTYEEIRDLLRNHLQPEPLIIPSSNTFLNRKQQAKESVSTYLNDV